MELLQDPASLILLALVGLIAGFIDAVVGGGGLLSIPALLSFGLPPHQALGTNKLSACFGSATAAWTYYRQQLLTPAFWRHSATATLIGALLGTIAVYLTDAEILQKLLPLIIMAIALYTLLKPSAIEHPKAQEPQTPASSKRQWLQGLPLGFYDGYAGPGIGAFWTLSSSRLYRLPVLQNCALARAMTLISNITALTVFLIFGQVEVAVGLFLGASMMAGAYLGARSAIHFGLPFIRPVFILIVFAASTQLAWRAWF
ncbi:MULTISPECIES: TSUP family transporter [Shewanella]|uniref:TSUP family transporter n=1 Tax=Shewanella TaxID=22 RepID=UPI001C654E3A|nr:MULTISPECIES: TSUP family transporter [Shewanella]QYJ76591.1 TSUP family transporter [Shewanella sp. FJAT-52076]QYK06511.1 TSUP family transporter [Shewanella zhangzhouensis]